MATNRVNRKNRHMAKLNTTVKQRNPEERVFLEKEIPHKAYGSILVVVDGKIGKRVEMATQGLKISRGVPVFTQAAELSITDPYVAYYRDLMPDDQPLVNAQSRAFHAYTEQISDISKNAFILALVHYTDFDGVAPEVDTTEDDEERAQYGLPPALHRDMWSPLERKLDHVQHMILTDTDFAKLLMDAVNEAGAKVQEAGLVMEAEEVDEEGFQSKTAD